MLIETLGRTASTIAPSPVPNWSIDTVINHSLVFPKIGVYPLQSLTEAVDHKRTGSYISKYLGKEVTSYTERRSAVETNDHKEILYQSYFSVITEDDTVTWLQVTSRNKSLTNVTTIKTYAPDTIDLLVGNIDSDEAQGYLKALRGIDETTAVARVVGLFENPYPTNTTKTTSPEQIRIATSRIYGAIRTIAHPEETEPERRQWIAESLPPYLRLRAEQFVNNYQPQMHTLQEMQDGQEVNIAKGDQENILQENDDMIMYQGREIRIKTDNNETTSVWAYPTLSKEINRAGYVVTTQPITVDKVTNAEVRIEGICTHCQTQGSDQVGENTKNSKDHTCGQDFQKTLHKGLREPRTVMIAVIFDDCKAHGGVFHPIEQSGGGITRGKETIFSSGIIEKTYHDRVIARANTLAHTDFRTHGGNDFAAQILLYSVGDNSVLTIYSANAYKLLSMQTQKEKMNKLVELTVIDPRDHLDLDDELLEADRMRRENTDYPPIIKTPTLKDTSSILTVEQQANLEKQILN